MKKALLVSLLCGEATALSPYACAQSAYIPPPPQFQADPNGVDPKSVTLNYSEMDGSIGEATGDLELLRLMPTHQTTGQQQLTKWIFSLSGYAYSSYDASNDPGPGTKLGNTTLYVVLGNRTYSFLREYQSTWESADRRVSISTTGTDPKVTVTVTTEDGDVLVFLNASEKCHVGSTGPNDFCGKISSYTKANGEKWTYDYATYGTPVRRRPIRVHSNFGYTAVFEYPDSTTDQPSKACLVNAASVYTATLTACPAGIPSTSYSATQTIKSDGAVINYTRTVNSFGVRYGANSQHAMFFARGQCGADSYFRRGADINGAGGNAWTYDGQFLDSCNSAPYVTKLNKMIVTAPDAGTTTYDYRTVYSGLTSFIDPLPNKITNQIGSFATFDYGLGAGGYVWGKLDVITLVYPESNQIAYGYDYRRNRIAAIRQAKPGTGLANLNVSATYPATCTQPKTCNKPLSFTDARGNVTDYTYDPAHGGLLTETLPAAPNGIRPQKRYTYAQYYAWIQNSSGAIVQASTPVWLVSSISECRTQSSCIGTADETRTTFTYGSPGTANNLLMTSRTVAAGDGSISATTTWTYDDRGNRLTEDGPLAGSSDTTRWRYDAMRRVVGIVEPDPDGAGPRIHAATRNTYDGVGRLIRVEQGAVNSQSDADWANFVASEAEETEYNALDQKTAVRKLSGGSIFALTQYSYDSVGRLDCTAVRMNSAAFGSPPASACTLGTEGTLGPDRITKYTYDAAGQLLKTTLAYGTSLQTNEEIKTYTPNGKLATITDGENNRTTYEYDGHDRLQKTRFPVPALGAFASSTTDYEQLGYDANDNIVQRRLRDGQLINYTLDNLNRVTLKDVPASGQYFDYDVTYQYDLKDRITNAVTQPGHDNIYTYDALGRMTGEKSYHMWAFHSYDAAGRQTRLTWGDGFFVDYNYDAAGNVTAIRENGAATGIGVLATYSYDNIGRRTSMVRGNGTVTNYTYDAVSRLSSLTQDLAGTASDITIGSIGYNPASQIISEQRSNDSYAWNGHYNVARNYSTNGLNQLTAAGATALAYDGRGNLNNSGGQTYGYTSENRLTSSSAGAWLAYEPNGDRLLQIAKGASDIRFGYSGDQIIAEFNASPWAMARRYVPGPGTDDVVVWYEGSGTADRRWLHTDERGSVIAVSNASGAAIAINRYDEYGIPSAANIGRFQYTGQAWLPELGMHFYKSRIYSPTLGRFMQTDRIGYGDGINWYAYVSNDPVNGSDSTGTYSCGSSMNEAQCDTFTARQNEAIGQIRGQISAMKGLQTALQNGTKLTGAQQQLANRLNTYVGPKAGSNTATIGSVIKAGQSMLAGLQGNKPFQASPTANGTTYATNSPIFAGKLYPSFFAASPAMQRQIVAHESGHERPGVGDRRYTNGIGPYGDANARAIARYGPDESLTNADNLAFTFGFQRDDD